MQTHKVGKSIAICMLFGLSNFIYGFGKYYSEPKVKVENNIWVCDSVPKLTITVNKDLSYLGYMHGEKDSKSATSTANAKVIRDSYFWAAYKEDKTVERLFVISILNHDRPNWNFFDDLHDRIDKDRVIESGRFMLGKDNFRYSCFVGNVFDFSEESFLRDKDFHIPNIYILKTFEKCVTMNGETKAILTYCERLDSTNITDKSKWNNTGLFNDVQKNFANDFIGRSKNVFIEGLGNLPSASVNTNLKTQITQSSNQSPTTFDLETEIKKLDKMKSDNLITEEEYKLLRTKLIDKASAQ